MADHKSVQQSQFDQMISSSIYYNPDPGPEYK